MKETCYVVGFIGTKAFLAGVSRYVKSKNDSWQPDDEAHALKKDAETKGYHPVILVGRDSFVSLSSKHPTLR